jgi:hypothetical protein
MPKPLWMYLTALLHFTTVSTCSMIAEVFPKASHDRLTRMLMRIPIGFRVWKKGGPSKFELAFELLSYARNRLKCKPQLVLFDAWYPSKA